jgi:tRNA threonylcarbamoyladenosine modification (KEOPS) complex  Pcc1 subunit
MVKDVKPMIDVKLLTEDNIRLMEQLYKSSIKLGSIQYDIISPFRYRAEDLESIRNTLASFLQLLEEEQKVYDRLNPELDWLGERISDLKNDN